MTAQLTDHHGAIPVDAFDADHPNRPPMLAYTANARAETRLWGGKPAHARAAEFGYGERRMLAVGYAHTGDDTVYSTGEPHPMFPGENVKVWQFATDLTN